MKSVSNIFNRWQKFCSSHKIDRDVARVLYISNKDKIRENDAFWADIVSNFMKNRNDDSAENNKMEESSSSVLTTLQEIKSLLIYLSSEPVRHVRSFIRLEDSSNQSVLNKWRQAMSFIMNATKVDESISFAKIFNLLREKLIDIDLKFMSVKFQAVDDTSNVHLKALFRKKRQEFLNELIIPVIIPDQPNSNNATIYFLFNAKEIFTIIDSAYANETLTQNSVLTTRCAVTLEREFFLTRVIYMVLHAMIHLKCSLKFGNAFMTHDKHEYFDQLQMTVPQSLYGHFLQPYSTMIYNNDTTQSTV